MFPCEQPRAVVRLGTLPPILSWELGERVVIVAKGRVGDVRIRNLVWGLAAIPLVVAGCGSAGEEQAPEPEDAAIAPDTTETADGERHISEYELRVGDCIRDPADAPFPGGVTVVPCSEPHFQEAFAVYDLDGTEYRGDEEVRATAQQGCRDEFEAFTGIEYDESRYFLNFLYPTDMTWAGGDREVVCMIYHPDGEKSESLRDAGR